MAQPVGVQRAREWVAVVVQLDPGELAAVTEIAGRSVRRNQGVLGEHGGLLQVADRGVDFHAFTGGVG
jgi:hypothetical protein